MARLLASFQTRGAACQAFAKCQNTAPDLWQGFWRVFRPAEQLARRLQSAKPPRQTCGKASGEFSDPRSSLPGVCKVPKHGARPVARLLASFRTRGAACQAFAKCQTPAPDLWQGFWRVFRPAEQLARRLQSAKPPRQTCGKASGEFSDPRSSLPGVCKVPKHGARPVARLLASFRTRGAACQAFAKCQTPAPDLWQGFWRVFRPAEQLARRLQSAKTRRQTCGKASGEFSDPRSSLPGVCKVPNPRARPVARLLASFRTRGAACQAFAKCQNTPPDLWQGFWRVFRPAEQLARRLQSAKPPRQTCGKASGEFSDARSSLPGVCKVPKHAARPVARLLASFQTRGAACQAFAKCQTPAPDLWQGFWRVFRPAEQLARRLQSAKPPRQTCGKASGEFSDPRSSLPGVCKVPNPRARPVARLLASFQTRGAACQAFAKCQNTPPDLWQGFWRVFRPAEQLARRLQSAKPPRQTCGKASGEFSDARSSLPGVCKVPKHAARPVARLLASFRTRGAACQAFAKCQTPAPDLWQGFWRVFRPAEQLARRLQSAKPPRQTCGKASGEFSDPRSSLPGVCKVPKHGARPVARLLASFQTRGAACQAFAKCQTPAPDLWQGFWRVFGRAEQLARRLQSAKTRRQTCGKASGEFSDPRSSLPGVCKVPNPRARPVARLLASFRTRGAACQAFAKCQTPAPDLWQGFWRVFGRAEQLARRLQSAKTRRQTCGKASGEFSDPRSSLPGVCKVPNPRARPVARLLASFQTRGAACQAFAKCQNTAPDLWQGFWRVFGRAEQLARRLQSAKPPRQTCGKASGEFSDPRSSLPGVCKVPNPRARPVARLLASFQTRGAACQAFAKCQNTAPDLWQGFWRVFGPAEQLARRLQSAKPPRQTCGKASGEFSDPRSSLPGVCKVPKHAARPVARLLASFQTRGAACQAFAKCQTPAPDLWQGFWRVFGRAEQLARRLQSAKTRRQTCGKASGEFSDPRSSLPGVCKVPNPRARPVARLLASFRTRGAACQAFAKCQNTPPDLWQGFWRVFRPAEQLARRLQSAKPPRQTCGKASGEFSDPRSSLPGVCKVPNPRARPVARLLASFRTRGAACQAFAKCQTPAPDLWQGFWRVFRPAEQLARRLQSAKTRRQTCGKASGEFSDPRSSLPGVCKVPNPRARPVARLLASFRTRGAACQAFAKCQNTPPDLWQGFWRVFGRAEQLARRLQSAKPPRQTCGKASGEFSDPRSSLPGVCKVPNPRARPVARLLASFQTRGAACQAFAKCQNTAPDLWQGFWRVFRPAEQLARRLQSAKPPRQTCGKASGEFSDARSSLPGVCKVPKHAARPVARLLASFQTRGAACQAFAKCQTPAPDLWQGFWRVFGPAEQLARRLQSAKPPRQTCGKASGEFSDARSSLPGVCKVPKHAARPVARLLASFQTRGAACQAFAKCQTPAPDLWQGFWRVFGRAEQLARRLQSAKTRRQTCGKASGEFSDPRSSLPGVCKVPNPRARPVARLLASFRTRGAACQAFAKCQKTAPDLWQGFWRVFGPAEQLARRLQSAKPPRQTCGKASGEFSDARSSLPGVCIHAIAVVIY